MEQANVASQPISQPTANNQPAPSTQSKNNSLLILLLIISIIIIGLISFLLGRMLSPQLPVTQTPPTISQPTPTIKVSPAIPTVITTIIPTIIQAITTTPTSNVPADWKTYKDINSFYQVKIPLTWDSKSAPDHSETVFFSPEPIKFIQDSEGPFTPIGITIKTGTDIEKEVISYKESYQYKNFKEENIIIDGISSKKISGVIGGDGYFTDEFNSEVFIPKNGKIIQISYFKRAGVSEQFFDQFLSTFKLLP